MPIQISPFLCKRCMLLLAISCSLNLHYAINGTSAVAEAFSFYKRKALGKENLFPVLQKIRQSENAILLAFTSIALATDAVYAISYLILPWKALKSLFMPSA
ncbi:MAG: hypothetical protein Q8N60_00240 [Candidatus Diapherotrites archaeon]|nr:hypothetical protein [Candidatus Diapherotrites archaeon]